MSVVVDACQPGRLARFWAAVLGWEVTYEDSDEVVVEIADEYGHWADTGVVPLVFVPVAEEKLGKNRVHLDLASSSPAAQTATVERAMRLGGRRVDVGQGAAPWEVLADPQGNELCVLEPRAVYAGVTGIAAVVLDCLDPHGLAPFWQAATGWEVDRTQVGVARLHDSERAATALELVATSEPKTAKDRLHVDVAPRPGGAHPAEIARLAALGARPVDVGQRDVGWAVLADPEGHEFCVLTPR